jgi:hypothetical protein
VGQNRPEKSQDIACLKSKKSLDLPLFFLVTAEEYQVITDILQHYDNPYLGYAHCPEEILLCGPLYKRCPELSPEVLRCRHFAALWQECDPC